MSTTVYADTVGQVGQYPKLIYISTSETVAQATAVGFLNNIFKEGTSLSTSYLAVVASSVSANPLTTQVGLFNVVESGGNWSLVPVAPYYAAYAKQYTTVGGNAAEAITIAGALATDLAFVQLVAAGSNSRTVSKAVVTANTLTVTFSGDPGNDAIINYQLLRAAI